MQQPGDDVVLPAADLHVASAGGDDDVVDCEVCGYDLEVVTNKLVSCECVCV